MFPQYANEVLEICKEEHISLGEVAIRHEMEEDQVSRDVVLLRLGNSLDVMFQAAEAGRDKKIISLSGLIGGDSTAIHAYTKKGGSVSGDVMTRAMAYAMSCSEVNASMGRIVAAPTAGACGILPAVMKTFEEKRGSSREKLISALATAGAIGIIIGQNATISGAEGGCQAETGAAAAMASGAAVELMGGTPEMSLHAGSIVLMNMMGLVCDPVAGLVEIPCIYRNAQGTVNALTTADMIMAGVRSKIPFDEAVSAMAVVGSSMNENLRETGLGGIAGTLTGKLLREEIFGDVKITEVHKDQKHPREDNEFLS